MPRTARRKHASKPEQDDDLSPAVRAEINAAVLAKCRTEGWGWLLDKMFGPGNWWRDEVEDVWVSVNSRHEGPGQGFIILRPDGSWFTTVLPDARDLH